MPDAPPPRFTRCPKCGHAPLPADQRLPAACPGCGAVLAKVGARGEPLRTARPVARTVTAGAASSAWADRWLPPPPPTTRLPRPLAVALWALFAGWGARLIALSPTDGAIVDSFLHGPLLLFHEAGHVLFAPFGEWIGVAGGTLMQGLMPALIAAALWWRRGDAFGATFGLWLLGVSMLDLAAYVHDAADPRLMLLSGATGAEGGHDWIYLLGSPGAIAQAPSIARGVHAAGALLVVFASIWGAALLWRHRRRR